MKKILYDAPGTMLEIPIITLTDIWKRIYKRIGNSNQWEYVTTKKILTRKDINNIEKWHNQ